MVQPFIEQNLTPNEPDLKDLLNLHAKNLLIGLNCHHVGRIESFNAEAQTAKVSIVYKQTFFLPNPVTGLYDARLEDYPVAVDCPVIFLGGGDGALTFPISAGDECLVCFNDRDIDNWFAGQTGSPTATPRLHAFSDAIVLVGLRSQANVLTDFNENGVELRYGAAKLTLEDETVTATVEGVANSTTLQIDADGKITITNISGEFIATLLDALTTATTNTLLGPQPLVINPALLTILESFKA